MKQLVLYGDSLLAHAGKDRVLRLEEILKGSFLVNNCATSGFNTDDSLKRAELINNLPLDKIVISLGTNDAKPWKPVPLDKFQENIKSLVEIFGPEKVIWFLPPPLDEQKLSPSHTSLTNKEISKYREVATAVLVEQNVKFIDSGIVFQKLIDDGVDYHVEDGIHLNDQGYEAIFNELKLLDL